MDLLHLEQQRQVLEQNLEHLRQTLKHWQTWEAEYEGLKEELQALDPADLTTADVTHIATTYGGHLVNEKEVWELAGLDKGPSHLRTTPQVLGLIERRQEYVQKNIETVQRQFFDTEAKAEELTFAAASHGGGGGGEAGTAGLPLTEIHEELDDDGNVISSTLSRPEETTATVVESLRKAGLSESDLRGAASSSPVKELKPAITNASPPVTPAPTPAPVGAEMREVSSSPALEANGDAQHDDLERPSVRKKSVSFTADTKAPPERERPESEDGRKSVSFAEKVAVMPAAPPPDTRSVSFSANVEEIPPPIDEAGSLKPQAKDEAAIQKELRESFKPGEKVVRLNDDDEIEAIHVVIPEDESPEDAQTRREMLEYHLNEVGNIVAQMDLEDNDAYEGAEDDDEADDDDQSSFHTSSEYLDDEDTPYTTGVSDSEDDEEDEYGRSTKRFISDDYRQQMTALQQKLIGNLGPTPHDQDLEDATDLDLQPEDVKRLVIREKRSSISSASSESSEKKAHRKKRVSFAEALDVANDEPALEAQRLQEAENAAPVADAVVERSTAVSHSLPQTFGPRISQPANKPHTIPLAYETGLDDCDTQTPETEPKPPPGIPLAETLKERTPTTRPTFAPSVVGPDETDPLLQRRELASEYYRRRNEIIHAQGGFRADRDEDDQLGELLEQREDGRVRKVSKFRAARMKPL